MKNIIRKTTAVFITSFIIIAIALGVMTFVDGWNYENSLTLVPALLVIVPIAFLIVCKNDNGKGKEQI